MLKITKEPFKYLIGPNIISQIILLEFTKEPFSYLIGPEHFQPEKSAEDHAVNNRLSNDHAATNSQHPHSHL
jgi:hypothetical protein